MVKVAPFPAGECRTTRLAACGVCCAVASSAVVPLSCGCLFGTVDAGSRWQYQVRFRCVSASLIIEGGEEEDEKEDSEAAPEEVRVVSFVRGALVASRMTILLGDDHSLLFEVPSPQHPRLHVIMYHLFIDGSSRPSRTSGRNIMDSLDIFTAASSGRDGPASTCSLADDGDDELSGHPLASQYQIGNDKVGQF